MNSKIIKINFFQTSTYIFIAGILFFQPQHLYASSDPGAEFEYDGEDYGVEQEIAYGDTGTSNEDDFDLEFDTDESAGIDGDDIFLTESSKWADFGQDEPEDNVQVKEKSSEARANDIYDSSLPENGIPYSEETGYEPGNNDYARPVVKYFGREIDPANMPFDFVDVQSPEKSLQVFFSSGYRWEGQKVHGFYDPEVEGVIIDTGKASNTYDDTEAAIRAYDYPEVVPLMKEIFDTETKDLGREDKTRLALQSTFVHELTHPVVDKLFSTLTAENKVPEGMHFYKREPELNRIIVSETGAYLGQLAASPTPKVDLLGIEMMANKSLSPPELFASSSIKGMLYKNLGAPEYITDRIIEDAENEQDGYVSEEEKTGISTRVKNAFEEGRYWPDVHRYETEFINELTDDQINQAAREEYTRLFDQPPLPRDIVDLIPQETYGKVLEKNEK